MSSKSQSLLAFGMACLAALGVANLVAESDPEPAPLRLQLDPEPIERTGPVHPTSYAPMLEAAQKTVVSVHTAEVVRVARNAGPSGDPYLRRFFGLPAPNGGETPAIEERRIPQGVGSGVIIREDGYIITNNHVVSNQRGEDADEVLVRLNDNRELPATIVGRDPKTDIAVLKVEASGLPAATIADSSQIKVGDIVFAIGNPMGVGLTVTSGIVSAKERSIGIYGREGYESFIQTDASINPGNSGGALVDIEGRLIGINSAILSRSGGNIGIGFAIPSNLAANITEQLTATGEVRRGLIGVSTSDLSHDMAEAFGLDSALGALVEEVIPGLPAEQAGLRRGDVITALDGTPVRGSNALRLRVSQRPPGSDVTLTIVRDGKSMEVPVTLGDQSNQLGFTGAEILDGVQVSVLDDELRTTHGVPRRIGGLVITNVDASSPYARELSPGVVFLEINDTRITSLSEARAALRKGANKIYVYTNGRAGYIALRVP